MGRREARRWHDWVIVLGIVALGLTGVWTLWGGEIRRVIRPDEPPAASTPTEAASALEPPSAPTAPPSPSRSPPAPVTPPPGQAAGPF